MLLTRPSPERLELGLSSAGGAAAVAPLFGLSSDGGGVDPLFRFWCHLSQKVKIILNNYFLKRSMKKLFKIKHLGNL